MPPPNTEPTPRPTPHQTMTRLPSTSSLITTLPHHLKLTHHSPMGLWRPLPTDNASVVCSSAVTSPAASTGLPPSAPATISTATEMEQAAYFPKGEVINDAKDADNDNLAMVLYQPVVGTSSGHRGGIDVPTSTSLSTSKAKGVVAKGVTNVASRSRRCRRTPYYRTRAYVRYLGFHVPSTRIRVRVQDLHPRCGLGWRPALRNPGPICGIPRWGASTPLRYGAWDEHLVKAQSLQTHYQGSGMNGG